MLGPTALVASAWGVLEPDPRGLEPADEIDPAARARARVRSRGRPAQKRRLRPVHGIARAGAEDNGVLFHAQLTPEIPREAHDIHVSHVGSGRGCSAPGPRPEASRRRRRRARGMASLCVILSMTNDAEREHFGWQPARTSIELLRREWMHDQRTGRISSAAMTGALARRYHGLLVAALPIPHGRVVVLTNLRDAASERGKGGCSPRSRAWRMKRRRRARCGATGLPVWKFEAGEAVIEKRLVMPHQQNTVVLCYRLRLRILRRRSLELRPFAPASDSWKRAAG